MNPLCKKGFNKFVRILIFILSPLCTTIPIIVCSLTDNLWISALLILPCTAQLILIAVPIDDALEEYYHAHSKRGLIHEDDVYSLFEENGTANLHVADIDQLPRYNVEIPETKLKVVPVKAFWNSDKSKWLKTGEMTTKMLPKCTNCGMQFAGRALEDPNWKHCPCCGRRITQILVPKETENND